MDRYIGMDVHMKSCTIAVVGPSRRRLGSQVVETHGQALVEAIRAIPQPRHLCMRFALLRELGRTYSTLARDVVRTQNRLKNLYRSRGVATPGKNVYSASGREEFVTKLPPPARSAATLLYAELDAMREVKRDAHKQLVAESHRHPISRVLETCPGLEEIRVAQLIPVVVSPERFRTSRQFWSYCGLGIVMRSSSDWVQDDGSAVAATVSPCWDSPLSAWTQAPPPP